MSKMLDDIVKDIKLLPKKAKVKLKSGGTLKLLLQKFPYLLFAYFFDKIAWLYRISTKEAAFDKTLDIGHNGCVHAYRIR